MTTPQELITAGYKIFPCKADKSPATANGFKDATNDPQTVNFWQQAKPALWGIPAELNGFFAVDIDPAGIETWKELTDHNGFDYGPCQQTPRGGYHYLFRLPGFKVPNTAGKLGLGLDLRSAGYVCTGKGYTWQPGHDYTTPLLDAPAWLLEKIKALTEPKPADSVYMRTATNPDAGAGEYWLSKALEKARPGNRNETGFNLALQLRDSGLSQNEARGIMELYAARVPRASGDPYTREEALKSLAEAYRGTPREPAKLPGAKRGHMTNEKQEVYTLDLQQPPPEVIEYVRGFECTDTGNGQRFVHLHGAQARWIQSAGTWYIWDGTRWKQDQDGEAERRAKETAKSILQEAYQEEDKAKAKALTAWAFKSQSRAQITNMLELAKSEQGITIPFDQFDRNQYLLNFTNGTLDLKTGTLKPHHPGDFITKRIEFDYDDRAQCPRWLQFLDEIMDHNRPLIEFLQSATGYSLTGDTGEQIFIICYGKGANGKTVYLETMLNALGPDYAMNTRANTILVKDRNNGANNDVARLRGLRFVTVNEIPGRGRLDEAKVKEFTGGDTITARYLFHEDFSFKPEFKLFVRTNHKPVITGVDYGIWRRVRLVPFTVTIPPDKQDPKLQEKLKDEWPGIIRWAVLGCLAWQDEGLPMPEEVKIATQEYKRDQDTMQPFIEDRCSVDPGKTVKAGELYTAYKDWAELNGEKAMTNNAFGREMSERGIDKVRTGSDRQLTYLGIALRN